MPVPAQLVRRVLAALVLALAATAAFAAHGPQPDISIPLAALDFQPPTQEFMLAGSSMLTLDFVDNQHLLLTFEVHTLLKRIPGDPPTDQDRNIRALLLELPAGRVLARTEWRLHDRGQYLWNLGHGHFLLRIRDTLTTIAPLANVSTGAFQQTPFIRVLDRRIGAMMLTPEADVLTVETRPDTSAAIASDSAGPPLPPDPDPVQVNFYRLPAPSEPAGKVPIVYAGAGRTNKLGTFPITAAGYLETLDQGHQHWAFNFGTFAGQTWELGAFDSTCRPIPIFVSHSEFIAFGCHNTPRPQVLGGFNMRGDQMWQQGVFGDYLAPSFAFAPASGRFAFGRIVTTTPLIDETQPLDPQLISSQTVVVYQAESGKQILKVDCSPVEVAGENFALSPDGLSLGVIRNGAVEIYKLPELTRKEQSDLKLAEAAAPKPSDIPVHLGATPRPTTASAPEKPAPAATPAQRQTASAPPEQTQPQKPAAQQQAPSVPPATTTSADSTQGSQQPEHRKPPTLYTLPTDPQNHNSAK